MKNSALLCVVLLMSFTTFAQQHSFNIIGLTDGHTISNIELLSVVHQDESTYVIKKQKDVFSDLISSSIQNATIYETVFLRKTTPKGYILTTKLTGVSLSDIETITQDGGQLERFLMHFELEEIMH